MVVEVVAGTAAVLLTLVLLVMSVVVMVLGLYGTALGERFERCPRCHRMGLSAGRRMHPDGCPRSLLRRVAEVFHGPGQHIPWAH